VNKFEPNAQNLIDAALNREAARLPLYEYGFDASVVEKIIGKSVVPLLSGTYADRVEAYRRICRCGAQLGYDGIPFERCITTMIQNGAGLMGHASAIIETLAEIEEYPWDKKLAEYSQRFEVDFVALREALPEGMKAVGGQPEDPDVSACRVSIHVK
jgi:hypothetical protein